mmetsp:Transcript_60925/g.149179  ORF Transcript_60925/g.149179 Transcript_60925/m.149179 type:complete len:580 (+) Transcript_60925:227-1966(+)
MTAASNNNDNNNTIAIPDAWPPEVRERYQPVRELGRGGFASVILAKDKQKDKNNQLLVAMKIVGGSGKDATTGARLSTSIKNDSTYAHREIDILKDISHPNIMKCIDYWESSKGTKLYSATMALSYSKGPTLEGLLQYGGALSTTFARTVLSQVVDAIAYLHYHAVVHRDIKPDNVIITGAFKNQDTIWDNINNEENEEGDTSNNGKNKKPKNGEEKKPEQSKAVEESEAATTTKADDDDDDKSLKRFDTTFTSDTVRAEIEALHWKTLRQKWKVTLVDFGFARALTPEDVASPSLDLKNENTKAAFSTRNLTKGAAGNDADNGGIDSSRRKQRSNFLNRSRHSLLSNLSRHSMINLNDSSSVNRSIHFKRRMSALGNRNFAAPEIVNKVRHDKTSMTASGSGGNGGGEGADGMDITQTISEYVAEYGLMVDAYSLGHTIRYCMTGVPPYMGVEEAIQDENSLCNKLCGTGGGGKNKKTGIRSPHYRRVSESPAEAQRLITNLCQSNEKNRTSVRKVRQTYPWIYQAFSEEENETSPWVSESRSKVEYLQCAITKSSSSSNNNNNNKTKEEEEEQKQNN